MLTQRFTTEDLERIACVLEEGATALADMEEELFEVPLGAEPLEAIIRDFVELIHEEIG